MTAPIPTRGVIPLGDTDDDYWGEVDRDAMERALVLARTHGWRVAVREVLAGRHAHLREMVEGDARVDWLRLLPPGPRRILEVGSGWGQTSVLLARDPRNHVLALERVRARAEFIALRRDQDGIANLDVAHGDFLRASIEPSAFDLVTMIGVLEWLGLAGPEPAAALQARGLARAHAALRPGGWLCIGIENRWGINNLLGARDHTGLRFTSVMPRWLADAYVRARRPSYRSERMPAGYRTLTHSGAQLRRMLCEHGFTEVQLWVVHPHYAQPRVLLPADDAAIAGFFADYRPRSIKDAVISGLMRSLAPLGLAARLAPHFVVLARR